MTDRERSQLDRDLLALIDGEPDADVSILDDPENRARYLDLVAAQVLLIEQLEEARPAAPARPAPAEDTARRRVSPATWALSSLAAALLFAAAAVAIYMVATDSTDDIEDRTPSAPVATLIESTGTLMVDDSIANEGSEYAAGLYSIASGSAELVLTSRVSVNLTGATQIVMHNPMLVTLERGTAEFTIPAGAEGFSTLLPDGSTIVDMGTRFRVTVNESGDSEMEVLEGAVALEHRSGRTIKLTADQFARVPAADSVEPEWGKVVADIGGDWIDPSTLPNGWQYLRSTAPTDGHATPLTPAMAVGNATLTGFGSPGSHRFHALPAVSGGSGSGEYEVFVDGYEGADGRNGNRAVEGQDLLVHPGNAIAEIAPPTGSPFVVLRYTISEQDTAHGNTATIEGGFRNVIAPAGGGNSVSVYVVHRDRVLFAANGSDPSGADGNVNILGADDGRFNLSVAVEPGDNIDFVVGSNGSLPTDETAVRGRILLSSTSNGSAVSSHENEPSGSNPETTQGPAR